MGDFMDDVNTTHHNSPLNPILTALHALRYWYLMVFGHIEGRGDVHPCLITPYDNRDQMATSRSAGTDSTYVTLSSISGKVMMVYYWLQTII